MTKVYVSRIPSYTHIIIMYQLRDSDCNQNDFYL